MPLVIIESPNKIKKLTKILGSNYKVMATVGHFLLLSKKNLGFDQNSFEPDYYVDPQKQNILNNILLEAKNHREIYIATDPDREGEAIAMHIYNKLPKKGRKIKRIKFNAITKKAVFDAIKNYSNIDEDLYNAQTARRLTDRIVGFLVTKVMWNKGLKQTSAGRVQSVALKIMCDREKKISNFVSTDYWVHDIEFKEKINSSINKFNGNAYKCLSLKDSKSMKSNIESKDFYISKVSNKKRYVSPKPPFTTSTLQQKASTKLGWSSKKTMDTAQKLFGSGYITYHRTDSTRSDPSAVSDIRKEIVSIFGNNYIPSSPNTYKNKDSSQDAHEAIRPTSGQVPMGASPDEIKLFNLIKNRFMASQMSDAEFNTVVYSISSKDRELELITKGQTKTFDGFSKIIPSKTKDVLLPVLNKGDSLTVSKVTAKKNSTKPPSRFNDATLVKILEEKGVGRPSTYASIIETLLKRKYVVRSGKSFKASENGMLISDYLQENFSSIVDTKFTAEMEAALDKVSVGSLEYIKLMKSFYYQVDKAVKEVNKLKLPESFICNDTKCPKCNSGMRKNISKNGGVYLSCSTWPVCDGVIKNNKESIIDVEVGKACPSCSNIMIKRSGKFGSFWGCSSFPICRQTIKIGVK
jgi:DNA topoisomerase-1